VIRDRGRRERGQRERKGGNGKTYLDRRAIGHSKPLQRFPERHFLANEGVRPDSMCSLVDEDERLSFLWEQRRNAKEIALRAALVLVRGPDLLVGGAGKSRTVLEECEDED
jgi:hypothetical protein